MKTQNYKPIGDHYGLLGLNADAPTFDVQCASLVYVGMARDLAHEVTCITNGSHEKSAAIFCEVIAFLLNTGLALMNEGFDEKREMARGGDNE